IYDDLTEYHRLYDIYTDYDGLNNIKTINDNAGIKPVKVDQKIIDMLVFSKSMYELTDGKTNIAYGSVLKIWHEYRTDGIDDPENAELPPLKKLQEASEHTDINDVIIDRENSTVFLSDPMMSLDVGAIAKGYATEQVADKLAANGLVSGILNVGGNVRAIGNNIKTGEPWSVGIQNPDSESEEAILNLVNLEETSMVSSGDYERYYTVDGKRYNHIIDTKTLFPAENFTAVTVICEDSGMADALSTAIYCMDFEQGHELIQSIEGSEAMWVFKDKSIRYSEGFEALIKK
nr:FAD:protein FMN transferase [Proteocatella sp.]